MSEQKIPIPAMLYNAAVGGHVTNSQQIIDENENKEQSQINLEVKNAINKDGEIDTRITAAVNTEKQRAQGVEGEHDTRINNLENAVGSGGSIDSRIASAVATEASRAQTAEEQLRTLYNNLQQSQPIPVTSLPATGEAGKIYRLAGTNSYADYMYAEGALTTPVKMAEYDNAIDDEPTVGSDNLVKSGGVINAILESYIHFSTKLVEQTYDNSFPYIPVKIENGKTYIVSLVSQSDCSYELKLNNDLTIRQNIGSFKNSQTVMFVSQYDGNYICVKNMVSDILTDKVVCVYEVKNVYDEIYKLAEEIGIVGQQFICTENVYTSYPCLLPAGKYVLELTNKLPDAPTGVFFYNSNHEQINDSVTVPTNSTVSWIFNLPEDSSSVEIAGIGTELKILEYGLKGVEIDVENLKNPTPVITNTIIVDANGTIGTDCDFTDIKSALDSISYNTQYNRYVVVVKNGTYDITGIDYLGFKNYVTVKGETRDGVIVRNSSQSYNASVSCFDPSYYGCNIEYASIENLTMRINNGKCCVHIDGSSIVNEGRILIKHCCLINEVENSNGGVNCGLNGGQTVEIDDCYGICLAYAHTRVNPSTPANQNNFIVKNSCFTSIGFYDISDKVSNYERNKLIVENCKCDYIGIGVAESALNKSKCSIDYIIDKNTIFDWVYIEGQNFISEFDNWFTKYPICSSIHRFVSNNSGNTITKGTFVSILIQGGVIALNNTLPNYGYNIIPYDGEHLYGIALEDIADGDAGIVQVGGKIFIPNNNYVVGQYITLNAQGQPIVGTKENAIGVVTNPDQPFIGQTLMLLTNIERVY